MEIEKVIKSNINLEDSKKIILNIIYTQNVIGDKFNEIIEYYREKYNSLFFLKVLFLFYNAGTKP
jgi:hypothetical protein